jgi:hypothetical protein
VGDLVRSLETGVTEVRTGSLQSRRNKNRAMVGCREEFSDIICITNRATERGVLVDVVENDQPVGVSLYC